MPAVRKHNRPSLFGRDCVLAITDFRGFLGSLDANYAAISAGSFQESATPWGIGLEVVTEGRVSIDLGPSIPTGNTPSTIFVVGYYPQPSAAWGTIVHWGNPALRQARTMTFRNNPMELGGSVRNDGDVWETTAKAPPAWFTHAYVVPGTGGSTCQVFADGVPGDTDVIGADCTTPQTVLRLFARTDGLRNSPIGTMLQSIIVFNTVKTAADIAYLHNRFMGSA